jgi:hypothetical protein
VALLSLNRNVHDVSLAVHEQESKISGFDGFGETLEVRKTVDMLPVQFQHDVTRL